MTNDQILEGLYADLRMYQAQVDEVNRAIRVLEARIRVGEPVQIDGDALQEWAEANLPELDENLVGPYDVRDSSRRFDVYMDADKGLLKAVLEAQAEARDRPGDDSPEPDPLPNLLGVGGPDPDVVVVPDLGYVLKPTRLFPDDVAAHLDEMDEDDPLDFYPTGKKLEYRTQSDHLSFDQWDAHQASINRSAVEREQRAVEAAHEKLVGGTAEELRAKALRELGITPEQLDTVDELYPGVARMTMGEHVVHEHTVNPEAQRVIDALVGPDAKVLPPPLEDFDPMVGRGATPEIQAALDSGEISFDPRRCPNGLEHALCACGQGYPPIPVAVTRQFGRPTRAIPSAVEEEDRL